LALCFWRHSTCNDTVSSHGNLFNELRTMNQSNVQRVTVNDQCRVFTRMD
jgi:hypothetical protein